jgi:hypothetical protein
MATRALIGYFDDDRVLTSTYNHYDGYPDHLGKMLNKYFSNEELAKKIAGTGYISYIDDDGNIESKNKMNPEKTELGRDLDWEDALFEMAKQIDNYGADFAYIWYEGDGDWSEIKNTGTRSMVDQLANQLASAATMYGPIDEEMRDMKKENLDEKMKRAMKMTPFLIKLQKEKKIEMVVDRVKEIQPLFPGMSDDILIDFVNTHIEDIKGASDEDIKDEFEEFFSVNYETGADYMEEENIGVDLSDATAGDSAIERESASGAFEEAVNWRGETLKEQFKRLAN